MYLKLWLSLITGVFLVSCLMPAASSRVISGGGNITGYEFFLDFGFMLLPAWWANPMLLFGIALLAKRRPFVAFLVGIGASLLAATTLLMGLTKFLLPGNYVWQTSFVLFSFVAAGYCERRSSSQRRENA
jgi:hypothetical protein